MTFNLLLAAASTAVAAILWQQEVPVVPLVYAALVVALLLVVAALIGKRWPRRQLPYGVAWAAVVLLALLLLVLPMFLQIEARRATEPWRYVHDGALQVEEAVGMLDARRNPYAESYRGTALEHWSGKAWNPAVDHLVYPPGYILLADAAARIARPLVGFYDDRFLSFTAYLGACALAVALARTREWKLRAAIGIGLNPLILPYLANGRNDTVVFVLLAGSFALLALKRPALAGAAFGAALTVKAFAALLLPAFLLALLLEVPGGGLAARLRARWVPFALLVGVVLAAYLPFLLWNAHALYDDLVRYPTAGGLNGYPIQGGGLSVLFVLTGVVRNAWDPYPFWPFQRVAVLAVAVPLALRFRRRPSVPRALRDGTATMLAGSYTSRFFTENHVGLILFLGWFWAVLRHRERSGP